ncbi:pyruvate formate lyase family protein, partial [Chloroflexota bacterium]
YIGSHRLIVGYHSEDPSVLPHCIEVMDAEHLESYISGGFVKEEEVDEWRQYTEYWRKRSVGALQKSCFTEKERKMAYAGHRYFEVLSTRQGLRTQPDHDLVLDVGLNNTVAKLRQKLETLYREKEECADGARGIELFQQIDGAKAMLIALEGFLRWTNRHSQAARDMAEKEMDPVRKGELLKIAEICSWVPGNPPRSFWEALQSHWFSFLGYQVIETLGVGVSARLDQIFWPWYEKDILIDRTLPRERALELMQNFLLNVDELGLPLAMEKRTSLQGTNFLAIYTIGGVKPEDGADACNELTLLILDAIDDLRMCHPDFKFRWHPKVNPKVWRRVVEVIRSGLGQPSIKNDQVAISTLMHHYGFSLEEARSWAVIGCISPGPTINSKGACRRAAFTVPPCKYLELALNNGTDPVPFPDGELLQASLQTGKSTSFITFDELFEAFRQQIALGIRKASHLKTLGEHAVNTLLKRPFASCFYHRSLDTCVDVMDATEPGLPWFNMPGVVDAVDSLISLKKLVFEDKKYTMSQVLTALRANWEGYEVMRQEFINAPKFGNNDDFADEVAKHVYNMIADEANKVTDKNGASPMPSGLVVTWMFSLAPLTGALSNGRKLGDPMADGGISPHAGYDRNGPMAAILSAAKIDSQRQKANIFNQKLSPSSVEGESGLRKLQNYIETAMTLGLDMVQFNVVDAETLREAQRHPEQYKTLVVRVSGYNARFADLNKFVQDAVIARSAHALS